MGRYSIEMPYATLSPGPRAGRRATARPAAGGPRRYELRRIQRHLERLKAQRESPFFVKDTERAIAALEARLRTLLADKDVALDDPDR